MNSPIPDLSNVQLDAINDFLNPGTKKPGLPDKKIDIVQEFLDSHERAMNFEHLDGFFTALICGLDPVPPDEFLPYIFGGEMPRFESKEQADEIMGILLEHWNYIADALAGGISYYPFLYADKDEKCSANDWADGFLLGVQLRESAWADLLSQESEDPLLHEVIELRNELTDLREGRGHTINSQDRDDMVGKIVGKLQLIFNHYASIREQG
jgi:uncharacterized protein